nr:uncharacterized protein LOC110376670 [Helicoverpa armigera]
MIWQLLSICLLCSASLAENYLQADLSFTDTNNRFDLTEMMGAVDRSMRHRTPLVDDNDSFRRQGVKLPLTRRADDDGDFAYHDRMDSKEGGAMSDFEENLKHFQRIKGPSRRLDDDDSEQRVRRSADDSEVLMNHVLPFIFKVDGYLRPPL